MSTNQTKFNFTNGTNFLLDNSPYIGFFNIVNSEAYTGKIYSESSRLLDKINNISTDYYFSNNFKDRNINDPCVLPNTLESILIDPNEIVSSDVLNLKIKKLQENLLYIYSKLFIASTDSPNDKVQVAMLTADDITWFDIKNNKNHAIQSSNPFYKQFTNLKKLHVIENDDSYTIFSFTNTNFIVLTSTKTFDSIEVVINTSYIDNNTTESHECIEDISIHDKNLFLIDSITNQIYKYSIEGFVTQDILLNGKRFLIKTAGGKGSSKLNFNYPTTIYANGDNVLVFDKGNNCVKIFDTNLVFKKLISYKEKVNVKSITWREIDNTFYFLVENNNINYLYVYDNNFVLIKTIQIDESDAFEIKMSGQDSNVFYLITPTSVFKKFFSSIHVNFAQFDYKKFASNPYNTWNLTNIPWNKWYNLWNIRNELSIKHVAYITNTSKNYDDIFLLGQSKIYHLTDSTKYDSVLLNEDILYYDKDQILVNSEEYNQSFVYNKSIYKLIYNLLQIKKYLRGKFAAKYNIFGNLEYIKYQYIPEEEFLKLNLNINYSGFINSNELNEANTMNRILKNLYRYQENLLNVVDIYIINPKTVITNNNILNID